MVFTWSQVKTGLESRLWIFIQRDVKSFEINNMKVAPVSATLQIQMWMIIAPKDITWWSDVATYVMTLKHDVTLNNFLELGTRP